MRFVVSALASIAALLLFNLTAHAAEQKPVGQVPIPADPLVTLNVPNATLADVIARIGQAYKVNLIADSYADDVRLQRVTIKDVPLREALAKIAELFERDVYSTNGIIVLRHRKWFLRPVQESRSRADFGITWADSGKVTIKRILPTQPAKKPARPRDPVVTTKTGQGVVSTPDSEPTLLVVIIKTAPLQGVATALEAHTNWKVEIERKLEPRRVSAYLDSVTPGQLLEALTLLVNARQQVALGQSPEQQQEEANLAESATPTALTDRERLADELRKGLLERLTPEQRNRLGRGESLEISVGSLPPGLQDTALQYLKAATDDFLRDNPPGFAPPNPLLFGDFGFDISLWPPTGIAFGIIGVDTNGNRISY